MRLLAVAALVGCYSAPSSNDSCTLACSASCPAGLSCVNGFCVAPGDRCEPRMISVRAGNGFACALDRDKRRWCWGANDQHQLDSSTRAELRYATLVDEGPWDALAAGGDHTCGLRAGALYCWGGNDRQQVSGTISGDVEEPLLVTAPNDAEWTVIAAGFATTCGIAGGRLYCWGANNYGQAGATGTTDIGAPSPVTDIADWTTVAIGRDHACGVSASAGLYCWGLNSYGQLADGATTFNWQAKPPLPVALPGVTAIAASGDSTCAIAEGRLYCWGRASGNALGDPNIAMVDPCTNLTSVPILATTLEGWTHIAGSTNHVCALRDQELWCWGATTSGLGDGVWDSRGFLQIADRVTDASVGWSSNYDDLGGEIGDLDLTCFIVDGVVKCWGDNRYGQLAQGTASMATVPTEVAGSHVWSTIEAGDSHMCGLERGVPLCWGTNRYGHLDARPTGNTSQAPCDGTNLCTAGAPFVVPYVASADVIKLGDEHTCALTGDVLTCWGLNGHGQLGDVSAMSPNVVPGAWTQLYGVGGKGQCAAQNAQTYCWGSVTSMYQPIARDTRMDNAKAIGVTHYIGSTTASGGRYSHGCVLGATNQLSCFGVDSEGQFGRGPPTYNCGNTICELGESETSCAGDCVGKRTCTVNSCGTNSCSEVCGDGDCNGGYGENCSTCAEDCGTCPYVNLGRSYEAIAVSWVSDTGFTCGVRPDRQIECWGRNRSGQAGALDPMTNKVIDPVYTPHLIAGLQDCTAVSAGNTTACGLCAGDIYCWGNHRFGAVGAGPPTGFPITTPRKVEVDLGDDRWAQLVSGDGFNCARTERGRAYCWGFHSQGALGTGGVSSNLPVDLLYEP